MFFRAAQPPNKIRNNYPKINRTNVPRRHPEHTESAPYRRPESLPQHRTCTHPPNACSTRSRTVRSGPVHAAFSSPRFPQGCRNRLTIAFLPRRTPPAALRFRPRFCTRPDPGPGGRRGSVCRQSPTRAPRANARRSIHPSPPGAAAQSTRNQFIGGVANGEKAAIDASHEIAARNCVTKPLRVTAALADSRIARRASRGTAAPPLIFRDDEQHDSGRSRPHNECSRQASRKNHQDVRENGR
jgi:hypothetical protein